MQCGTAASSVRGSAGGSGERSVSFLPLHKRDLFSTSFLALFHSLSLFSSNLQCSWFWEPVPEPRGTSSGTSSRSRSVPRCAERTRNTAVINLSVLKIGIPDLDLYRKPIQAWLTKSTLAPCAFCSLDVCICVGSDAWYVDSW